MGGFFPVFRQLYVLIWQGGGEGFASWGEGGGHLAHVWLVIHGDAIFTSLLKQRVIVRNRPDALAQGRQAVR